MNLPDRASRVCDRIAAGESLTAICADPDMPQLATVHRWLEQHPEFPIAYARARRILADRLADQMIEIADGMDEDAGPEKARSVRARLYARKWVISHLGGVVVPADESPPSPGRIVFCSPSDFAPKSPDSSR